MCRWMGSHFPDWIDCNGVALSIELLQWSQTFSDFFGQGSSSYLRLANVTECLYCKVFFIQFKKGSTHFRVTLRIDKVDTQIPSD